MAEKSSSLFKFLAGCGCLLLLFGGGAAAVVVGGGYWVASNADELAESGKQVLREQASRARERAEEAGQSAKQRAKQRAGGFDMSTWADAPVTRDDVDRHVAFMTEWGSHPDVARSTEGVRELREAASKKDPGALDTLRSANSLRKVATSNARLGELYDEIAGKHGGPDQVFARYFRVVAVAAAASDLAAALDGKPDPTSDAVAAAMLAQRPERAEAFARWVETQRADARRLEAMQSDPQSALDPKSVDAEELAASAPLRALYNDGPGLLLLGKIPQGSLTTWSSLDAATRGALIEEYSRMPTSGLELIVPEKLLDLRAIARALLNVEIARVHAEEGLK
jgi:hypothetical protein